MNAEQNKLQSKEDELNAAKAELDDTKLKLWGTEEQLEDAKTELDAVKAELQSAMSGLEVGKKELKGIKADLVTAREENTRLQELNTVLVDRLGMLRIS